MRAAPLEIRVETTVSIDRTVEWHKRNLISEFHYGTPAGYCPDDDLLPEEPIIGKKTIYAPYGGEVTIGTEQVARYQKFGRGALKGFPHLLRYDRSTLPRHKELLIQHIGKELTSVVAHMSSVEIPYGGESRYIVTGPKPPKRSIFDLKR